MDLNILLRGQSNAIFFDRYGGLAALQSDVQALLGFDGVHDKVNLLGGEAADAQGWATTFGGTALLPPNQYHWLNLIGTDWTQGFTPAAYEQSTLNYISDLSDDVRAAPTAILFMQDESDASVGSNETTAEWTAAVRYEAGQVRSAFGQDAATTPYLFVAVPFDSDDAATMQAIRLGQDELSSDPVFNASVATRTGDLDMNNPYNGLPAGDVIYGGPHLNQADVAILAARIAPSVADEFAQYALPGSPMALALGHVDDSGPEAIRVDRTPATPTQVIVTLQDDPSSAGLTPFGSAASSGLGWTVRDGDSSLAATSAQILPGNQVLLTFAGSVPTDNTALLYYNYGTGRIAVGADTHTGAGYPGDGPGSPGEGNGIYDQNGLPAWANATGLQVGNPPVDLVIGADVVSSGVTLYEGDALSVLAGGAVQGLTVLTGATVTVGSGGLASGLMLDGGNVVVSAGGTLATAVVSGGALTVAGSASGTDLAAGTETVLSGGVVSSELVDGDLAVRAGGVASSSTVTVNGALTAYDGGQLTGTFEDLGSVLFNIFGRTQPDATFNGSGQLGVVGGGTLVLAGSNNLSGAWDIDGSTLEFATAAAAGTAAIVFSGSGGTLVLDVVSPSNSISGMVPGGGQTIELRHLNALPAISRSGDSVTLVVDEVTVTLQIAGSASTALTTMAAADDLGAESSAAPTSYDVFLTEAPMPCYCAGSHIATPLGDRLVEALRVGDAVVTVSGVAKQIRWIGRRTFTGRSAAGRKDRLPIRIVAGALRAGIPRRDLYVSPCHALLLDGFLVPAGELINGCSITQPPAPGPVEYLHFQLTGHDIVFAEGVAAETFFDDDNHAAFSSSDGDAVPACGASGYYAPRISQGYRLERIRQAILSRMASTEVG